MKGCNSSGYFNNIAKNNREAKSRDGIVLGMIMAVGGSSWITLNCKLGDVDVSEHCQHQDTMRNYSVTQSRVASLQEYHGATRGF